MSLRIVSGQDYRTIVSLAESEGAGLIVLGTHRNEASNFFVIGTTMERVVREGSLPVLVVKGRVKGAYANVVVGVDFSIFSRAALGAGRRFAGAGKLRLVHACSVPFPGFLSGTRSADEVRDARRRDLADLIEREARVVEGEVHSVLRRQVCDMSADLLVIGTHSQAGTGLRWLGSVAETFLVRPPCDVLVVKAW